jgi:hypothetical protein
MRKGSSMGSQKPPSNNDDGRLSPEVAALVRPEVGQFLLDRGAATIDHPGGKLFDHLVRTAATLVEWGVSVDLVAAGLCHAMYGTDGFATGLASLDERDTVRGLVGDEAEAIVYCYAASDRRVTWPVIGRGVAAPYRDRFTDERRTLSPAEGAAYWTLTTANELDLIGRMPGAEGILPQLQRGTGLLSPVARQAIARRGKALSGPGFA